MEKMLLLPAIVLLSILLLSGCASQTPVTQTPPAGPQANPSQPPPTVQQTPEIPPASEPPSPQIEPETANATNQTNQTAPQEPAPPSWKAGGIAIAGKYADADSVDLGDGNYRLYYSAEPEIPNFQGQVYSALSSDGINWAPENGVRRTWSTFPSVLKLPDGRYRMYLQNAGSIKSAISANGLDWQDEDGVRIDTSNSAGLSFENVAAPTVLEYNGQYIMVYRGTINQKYPANVPNPNTQLFLWATSQDGLSFQKKGIVLDSRNEKFLGLLDGPELVNWDDGTMRLYFWSYKGIYYTTFDGTAFSEDATLDYAAQSDPSVPFPPNPPGDPAVMKINGKWFLYYGQHTQGIYYATLEN